jgi:hypothetical protein
MDRHQRHEACGTIEGQVQAIAAQLRLAGPVLQSNQPTSAPARPPGRGVQVHRDPGLVHFTQVQAGRGISPLKKPTAPGRVDGGLPRAFQAPLRQYRE